MRRYLQRRYVLRFLAAIVLAGVLFVGWNAVQLYLSWRSIDRIEFDLDASRAAIEAMDSPPPTVASADEPDDGPDPEADPPAPPSKVFVDDEVDVFLLVGSDADKPQVEIGDADAILLFLRPEGGRDPLLMSIPRDLSLSNPCTRTQTRILAALEGCGEVVGGPALLAIMVEDFTGLAVDHFAVLSFGAFREVVDRLGGVQVCLERESQFDATSFPAGCSIADGAAAQAWLRSRFPLERVDGEWQPLDSGDLARNQRQQDLLVQLLGRMKQFRSPTALTGLVGDLGDAVALDDRLTMGGAIDIAWEMRNIHPRSIQRPVLEVEDRAFQGKFVRVPTAPFEELLRAVYPEAAAAG